MADVDVPDTEVIVVAHPSPVFVDSTGRRSRMLRRIAYGFGALCMVYGGLVSVSLAGGPVSSSAVLPLPDLADGDDREEVVVARPSPTPEPVTRAGKPILEAFPRHGVPITQPRWARDVEPRSTRPMPRPTRTTAGKPTKKPKPSASGPKPAASAATKPPTSKPSTPASTPATTVPPVPVPAVPPAHSPAGGQGGGATADASDSPAGTGTDGQNESPADSGGDSPAEGEGEGTGPDGGPVEAGTILDPPIEEHGDSPVEEHGDSPVEEQPDSPAGCDREPEAAATPEAEPGPAGEEAA